MYSTIMYLSYLAFEPISLSIEYRFEDKLSIGEYDWFEVLGNRTEREAERATEWADECVYEWVCVWRGRAWARGKAFDNN